MMSTNMRKQYVPVTIAVLPIRMPSALCGSNNAGGDENFGGDTSSGGGSQGSGRAPHRVATF